MSTEDESLPPLFPSNDNDDEGMDDEVAALLDL